MLSSSLIPGANQITITGGLHDRLPSLAQDAVIVALTGNHPAIVYNTPDPESVLGILVASPVEIEITDQFGNIISRTLSQIPGAEFDSETDPSGVKMIMIPNPVDGEYKVKLTGIGDGGDYHLITGFADGDTDTSETKEGSIESGEVIEYHVQLTSGDNESPVETEIVDEEAPTAIITQPQDGSTHIDTEILQMELVSSDHLSGIKESRLFFDGALFATNTTTPTTTASVDLSLTPLGFHTIRGEADDNLNNATSTEITITSHTSFDTTIQNIQHYEDIGLLTLKPAAKKFFIAQLKIAKALAEQYTQKPTSKLKTAINAVLTFLTKEVQLLERGNKIDPRVAGHLKEAFEELKE